MKKAFVLILIALPAIQSFGWSMLAGTIGTLILAGFFSGIMSLETLSILLPIIVGANAAISGYMLIERTDDEIKRKKTMAAAVGTMVALGSFISVNALCMQLGGFFLMSASQGLVATVTGIVGGWSGGVLAVKYKELQRQVPLR
ncbi:hypothetical protein [Desulfosarcina sp.]|uniref:hypothetical protein n=1 Tax=Desulfosarcina sp. TaxID=2027861 RepID=UPI0029B4E073|nr:hypothetical protein [Desulfosarcina sp.]MDX2451966.1 hypothetical protein [Desulfosarcina sp.]MDX2489750.1 hypothetical protein [Desulfosarcina sp.]